MSKLLLKLPWFISAPLIVIVAAGFAYLAYAVTGDYFNERCKNERNPLSGEFEASNCGEGAAVAARSSSASSATEERQAAALPTSTRATAASPQAAQPATVTATSSPSPSPSPSPSVAVATSPVSTPAGVSSPSATSTAPATAVASAAPATASPTPTQPPTPPDPATPTVAASPKPGVLAVGTFKNGAPGHNGSGSVQVQRLADGKLNLFISNFSVTNGPDLYVVLSASPGGSYSGADFQVAKLKANNGSQNYALPDGLDLASYRSVIIWCKSFDVVFSYAPVMAQ